MNIAATADKPSFLDLWMAHRFDLPLLATNANVPQAIVQEMLNYKPVEKENVERVLFQLSALLHGNYSLETVYVPIVQPVTLHESNSEVARLLQKIDDEYMSAHRGLHDLRSGNAMHVFITKRLENIEEHLTPQIPVIGVGQVVALYDQWSEKAINDIKAMQGGSENV